MRSLVNGVRWMAVPIAAYLAITLVLPIANGAAGRAGFAEHAMWVVAGCAIVVGGGVVVAAVRRLVNPSGPSPNGSRVPPREAGRVREADSVAEGDWHDENNRTREGVAAPGGSR